MRLHKKIDKKDVIREFPSVDVGGAISNGWKRLTKEMEAKIEQENALEGLKVKLSNAKSLVSNLEDRIKTFGKID